MTGGDPPFRVIYPEILRQGLREWMTRAIALGIGTEFFAVVKEMQTRLESDPVKWGDPQNRLQNMDLLVCHRLSHQLLVRFAVDEKRRLVYVTELRLLPGHPLEQGPSNPPA